MLENFIRKLSKKDKFKFAIFILVIVISFLSLITYIFLNTKISLMNNEDKEYDEYRYLGDGE